MNVYCVDCGHRRDAGTVTCPMCGGHMGIRLADVPPQPEGMSMFDHTFTPWQAAVVVSGLPEDSHHWVDIPRKRPGAVDVYAATMVAGRWQDQTMMLGFVEHPVRFDSTGYLTHGILRLLACIRADRSFRTAVVAPDWLYPEVFGCVASTVD